jgi:hypothetical protein
VTFNFFDRLYFRLIPTCDDRDSLIIA